MEITDKREVKRLRRSRNRVIGGVCQGLADYTGTSSALWRIAAVISLFFTFGTTMIIYIFMWIIIPKETRAQYYAR